jgi:hypothetical protein
MGDKLVLVDIGPQYSDVERAYALWCQRIEHRDVGRTSQQIEDLADLLDSHPISVWQIFEAGWDARIS